MNQVSTEIDNFSHNTSKEQLYDFISGSLDSIMQTSNYDLILANLNKEQLIALLELSYEKKKNLPINSINSIVRLI